MALVATFPPDWACTLSDVTITRADAKTARTLEISIAFKRSDIGEIYRATKLVMTMMKSGKNDAELNALPPATLQAAASFGDFLNYVGQVWGCSVGAAADCSPPIDYLRLPILDANGARIGAVGITRTSAVTILGGKIKPSEDRRRFAGMFTFE